MHGVDRRVCQELLEIRVAPLHSASVSDSMESFRIALANSIAMRARMPLPDGYKLGTETKTDHGNIEFARASGIGTGRFGQGRYSAHISMLRYAAASRELY